MGFAALCRIGLPRRSVSLVVDYEIYARNPFTDFGFGWCRDARAPSMQRVLLVCSPGTRRIQKDAHYRSARDHSSVLLRTLRAHQTELPSSGVERGWGSLLSTELGRLRFIHTKGVIRGFVVPG